MRLARTMETMHAAGRRSLPPVPRASAERTARATGRPEAADQESDTPTERFVVDLATGEQHVVSADATGPTEDDVVDRADTPDDASGSHDAPTVEGSEPDLAQKFVARLRGAAADFADAAGAESAVVREAVPPARHRRARCRLVLRYADASEIDVTFLGPAGLPGRPSRHGFDRQIRRWLATGQRRDDAWLVSDPDAPDGVAVDLSAWVAAA